MRTDPTLTPAPSELYVYVGTKKRTGNAIERAGLTGGHLHGVQVVAGDGSAVTAESNTFALGAAAFVGSEGHRMLDNLTLDPLGRVVMVEDVGNNARLGKLWLYDLATGNLIEVAAADPARFLAGAPGFRTQDEEVSGIVPAFDLLGPGWYLLTVQAHHAMPGELVEGGQLLALWIDPELGR